MIEVIDAKPVPFRPTTTVYLVLGRMGSSYWNVVTCPATTLEEAERSAASFTANYECFRVVKVDNLPVRLPEVKEV